MEQMHKKMGRFVAVRPEPAPGVSSSEELVGAAEEAKTMLVMLCPADFTRKRLEVARIIGRLVVALEQYWTQKGQLDQRWKREMDVDFKAPEDGKRWNRQFETNPKPPDTGKEG